MQKNIILYVRVSTDEQAEKGHSLPAQIEKLKKFCSLRNWNILEIFSEDFSAWHGFNRPAYNKLKEYVLKNKKNVDFVLFTQWSRFSRDTTASYNEIRFLQTNGIEPNAIEQWIDLKIPENKYLLSFYLTAPQVENERLSLRVKFAIRHGLKTGKWMGKAPYGYINNIESKMIFPNPATKDIVKYCFETFATGLYPIEELRRMAVKKGLTLKKQQFINMLRNPAYIGKIIIQATDEEEKEIIKGLHEAIIDEETFIMCQDILNKKKKPYKGKTKSEELHLKGFIQCPKCGKLMTGSASEGNGGTYHYYHCQRKYGCNKSYSAQLANKKFEEFLTSFKVDEPVLELYKYILEDTFKTNDIERVKEKGILERDISNIDDQIKRLDERIANEEMPIDRYNRIVTALEGQKNELVIRHATLRKTTSEIDNFINYSLSFFADLPNYYQNASFLTKGKILGSIFPKPLIFDGNKYRTKKMNEVFELIASVDNGFKRKQLGKISKLSNYAPESGLEPETL